MSKQQKRVSVEIISLDELNVGEVGATSGWGEKATVVDVSGKVAEITVSKDGESQFGIRILEDGSIIVTNYRSYYTTLLEANLRLTNTRPWQHGRRK